MSKANGFTLLEMVIALSISSMILLAGAYIFSTYYRFYKSEAEKAELLQVKQMVLEKIIKDCRQAHGINVLPNKISLSFRASHVSYDFRNGKVRRVKDNYSAYLTDTNQIGSLNFLSIKPNLIKVSVDSFEARVSKRNE